MYALQKGLKVAVGHVLHDECNRVTDSAGANQCHNVSMVTNLLHQLYLAQQLVAM